MIPVEFKVGKRQFNLDLPESWEEVPNEKLPAFLELVCRPQAERRKILTFLSRMGIKKRWLKPVPLILLREVMKPMAWINEPWSDHRFMMGRIGVFSPPKASMERMAFNQLIMAGLVSEQIQALLDAKSKDLKRELARLASILYTFKPVGLFPVKSSARGYIYSLTHLYSFFFRLTPLWRLQAISVSFLAQRKWLEEYFPLCHQKTEAGGIDHGPYGLIVDLAGEKFGKIESVHYSEVMYVMTYLEKLSEEREKLKQNAGT